MFQLPRLGRSVRRARRDLAAPPPAPDGTVARGLGHVPGFDGVRGVAVLIVFVSHMEIFLPIPQLLVVPGGTVSLDSFFVLSGFLITFLLLREQARRGRVSTPSFYSRRFLRLVPALFFMLAAWTIFSYAMGTETHRYVPSLLSVLFYYSNYYVARSPNAFCANLAPGFQHLWSLSFEEQFYILWPWLTIAFLSVRHRLSAVVSVIGGAIVVIGVYRGLSYTGVNSWCSLFHQTQSRADAILWGALLAHLWIRGRTPKRFIPLAATLCAVFLVACLPFTDLTGPFLYRGGFDAIDLACAVVLLGILDGRWRGRKVFELRPFVLLGMVSYGFYVWHLPLFYVVHDVGTNWSYPLRVVVAVASTLAMTTLSWFLLERRAMRLKGRLSRQAEASPDQAPGRQHVPVSMGEPP